MKRTPREGGSTFGIALPMTIPSRSHHGNKARGAKADDAEEPQENAEVRVDRAIWLQQPALPGFGFSKMQEVDAPQTTKHFSHSLLGSARGVVRAEPASKPMHDDPKGSDGRIGFRLDAADEEIGNPYKQP
jgi:hypothetical protein